MAVPKHCLAMGAPSLTVQRKDGGFRRAVTRILLVLILAAVAFVLGAGAWLYRRAKKALPQLDGTIQVPGLHAAVEVLRDAHGVPHLRAHSLEDLFFAQGYVTAQDRLFQMDLNRRLAMGQLSEILGESVLRLDIENRTLGFPQVAERAVHEMDAGSRQLMDAYSAGVNALITSRRDNLPIEFLLLRYTPRPWRAEDSLGVALNMFKTLNNTWRDELMRERIRAKLPPELEADLFPDRSELDHPVAEQLQSRVATGKQRAIALPPFPSSHELGPMLGALAASPDDSLDGIGSNNWVVSGAHTRSGKPLLANDPHLAHSLPSVWYMIHLKASGQPDSGLDVSGVSLPGLPLVIIGHNQRVAWGVTNTGPDVQDLYDETFNLQDSNKYLHNGEWLDAQIRQETIHVRHSSDYTFTVKATRHGPVISHEGDRDLALRWTALDPGALRFAFLKIDRAQDWQEFTEALRDFAGPMQNFVYADVDGNIGYYAAGWVPIRKQGDGSVPSPGSADENDWTGTIPFEELPHAYNPSSGMIATANGRIVPDGYPYFITHRWAVPFRTARIFQLLERGKNFTVPDMLRIQTDIRSLEDEWLAKELVEAAKKHPPVTPDAQYAVSLLANYDGEARADSAATLVCEVARKALLKRILSPRLGEDSEEYNWSMSTVFLQNVLKHSWTRWLPPGDADFDATLVGSLEDTVARIPALTGARERTEWQWGRTIPLTFRNRLTLAFPLLGRYMNVGPVPQAGTQTTVKQTTPAVGPSMRMVVDLADLEQSVQNITLGESEQLLSPYYRDQFDAWYNGRSFPLLFGDEAVDRNAVHKLVLEPGTKPEPPRP